MEHRKSVFPPLPRYGEEEQIRRSAELLEFMKKRRSIRTYSPEPVPLEVVKNCVRTAATAPSGANKQPWTYIIIGDGDLKHRIRIEAEAVELEFYQKTISRKWKEALLPLGTNQKKPFLEEAPYLIAVFVQRYGISESGEKVTHYFPDMSVGISTGILISALHHAGLSCLTYTPAPLTFIHKLLKRPPNEKPYMIVAVGRAAEGVMVPDLERKAENSYLEVI